MKRILVSLIATILGLIIGYTGYTYRANHLRLKLELQQTQKIKQELDNKLQQTNQEKEQLKKQNDDLQIQLQAKKQRQAVLASVRVVQAPRIVFAGDWVTQCRVWASQAGITLDDSAIKLLERESHCSPTVCNPNGVACGIPQALPWTKMGCELSAAGAPCQLRWFQNYVFGRYGSFANALAHSYAYGWY